MAITIDWTTKVISIPKADMPLVTMTPFEIRELDINTFRLILKDLEDDSEGMTFSTTHNHIAPISVGGVSLARVVELINGYTVTFEDGQYAVNITGGNSNIGDNVNLNQVSVRSANSAGLVEVPVVAEHTPAEIALAVWQYIIESGLSAEQSMRLMNAILGGKVSGAGSGTETFRNPADTKNRVISTVDSNGNRTNVTTDLS